MPKPFPESRLRQAGISTARVTQLQAAYNAMTGPQQDQFRAIVASRPDEILRRTYDPTGTPADPGASVAQVVADPALLTAVQTAILAAHDTDTERETFVPARLADTALRAAFAPLGAFGPSAKLPARRTITKIVDLGAAGHGWTANSNSAAASNVNDATVFARGTQSAKIVTKGDGTVASVQNKTMAAVDLTGKRLEVSVMVDDWTHVVSVFLYLGDNSFANFRVLNVWNKYSALAGGSPVTPADNGEWVTFTVDMSSLASTTGTPNLAAVTSMQVAIQDDGSGPVTMHVNHVGSFPGSAAYPSGVVSFTFDDSFLSQKTAALPYLERYNFPGTLYTIVDKLDANPYYLTTAHLRAANDVGGHEVAAHAYTSAAHDGAGGFTALTPAALDQELRMLKRWLVTNRFRGHNHLALPQGATNRSVETAAASYFSSNRGTLSVPVETLLPGNPLRLRTGFKLNTPSTLAQAKAAVDAAYANGSWLILTTHDLVTTAPTPAGTTLVQWDIASFQQLVDYIASKAIPVRTCGDVLATA